MAFDDYVPTPQWATNRLVVADGEQPDAASIKVTSEDVYDRLEYLYDGENVETVTKSYGWTEALFEPSEYSRNVASGALQHDDVSSGNLFALWPLRIPVGAEISQLVARLNPAGGHGALPAAMPELTLWRQTLNSPGFDGLPSLLDTEVDGSASVVAYEAAHSITMSSIGHTVEAGYIYYARFEGESSTNAVVGTLVYGLQVTFTTDGRDGGAA